MALSTGELNLNAFNIVATITMATSSANVSAAGGTVAQSVFNAATIAHNQSEVPMVIGAMLYSGTYYTLPFTFHGIDADNIRFAHAQFRLITSATNITLQEVMFASAIGSASISSWATTTSTVKFYILREAAN